MTCKDCIYRAMCYKHEHYGYGYEYNEKPCEMFKNKADVVEVVRCKDCEHREDLGDRYGNIHLFCTFAIDVKEVESTDYCSYGARKDVTDINVGDKKE